MQCHDRRAVENLGDGRDIAYRVVGQLVNRRVRGVARRDEDDGVAIRYGAHGSLHAHGAAAARAIVHDDLFAECFGKLAGDGAGNDIGSAAGCKRNDQPDGFRGIGILHRRAMN